MAGEIIYADLRHPGDGFSSAEKRHAPALCPRWHGVVLKVSGLGHLVLLVLVVVLSAQVFQGSLQPVTTSIPWQGSETRGKNHTEQCVISALMQYYCKPRQDSPTGNSPRFPPSSAGGCSGGIFDEASSALQLPGCPWGYELVTHQRVIWQRGLLQGSISFCIHGGAGLTPGRRFLTTLPPPQPAICVPVATQPQSSSSFPVTEQEKTQPCDKDSRMGKEPRRGMGKPLVPFRWWLGKTLTTLWVASWLFLLFSLCWLQAVSPGLAAPRGQMLPAFQGNGELESRQERLRKSGGSAGNAPGQERRGVHQEYYRRTHTAGVDWITIIPQEMEMGGQHTPQHHNVSHPAGGG
ncbi:PREDICTED: uncharacterized protein LOC104832871 isoform X2 [Haliaeetus leucocephalus]|uniref:uncharacterized protein LOC104832871 isoform X2 n=1 Tax=Haliaeetus leucocephalus TaxID=52644 RepID=UPI00053CED54|nr:PREDICTED: uncharacterized protein LOC104832871 isoform X2 [Haliaeetus leucocephalus]